MEGNVNVGVGVLILMCGTEISQVQHIVSCDVPNEDIVQFDVAMDEVV